MISGKDNYITRYYMPAKDQTKSVTDSLNKLIKMPSGEIPLNVTIIRDNLKRLRR